MLADFAAEIVAGRVIVIATAGGVNGYMIAWPEADAYFIDNIAVDPECQGEGLGRHLIVHAATEAKRLRLPAVRLYTNVMMTENLSMYAHIGFVETHRAMEKGFHRVYMRWNLLMTDNEPPLVISLVLKSVPKVGMERRTRRERFLSAAPQ